MSERIPITIHVAPDVLGYLKTEAQGASQDLQHSGQQGPRAAISIEAVASDLLEQAVRSLIADGNKNLSTPVVAADIDQDELDHGTANRVLELLGDGHVEEAHELAKTIERPALRQEVDPGA